MWVSAQITQRKKKDLTSEINHYLQMRSPLSAWQLFRHSPTGRWHDAVRIQSIELSPSLCVRAGTRSRGHRESFAVTGSVAGPASLPGNRSDSVPHPYKFCYLGPHLALYMGTGDLNSHPWRMDSKHPYPLSYLPSPVLSLPSLMTASHTISSKCLS